MAENFRLLTEQILKCYYDPAGDAGVSFADMLDKNVTVIGTGRQEFYRSREDFLKVFDRNVDERNSTRFEAKNLTTTEQVLDEGHVLVLGQFEIVGHFESGTVCVNPDTRISILFAHVGDRWLAQHIHHSVPDIEQADDAEFPRTIGKRFELARREIEALGSIYSHISVLNMEKYEVEVIKSSFTAGVSYQHGTYDSRMLSEQVEAIIAKPFQAGYVDFVTVSTLDKRLQGKDSIEYTCRKTNGEWITTTIIPIGRRGDKLTSVLIASRDVTAEKEHDIEQENALRSAMRAADRANTAKTEFLLRMSHDIRTPINGIIGMLDIGERYSDDLDRQSECRHKVRGASKILLDIINDVLDMSKLESGEITLEHVPFDLIEVSKDVYNAIKRQADDRGIEIVQEDCSAVEAKLLGSPSHLKRLMMNIVSNAVKYNVDGGKIYITCREFENDGKTLRLQFKCRDTGIGMSPEFTEHIFEPFAQENANPRTRYAGTGLGMAIAKRLTDKMGGTITVESTQGVGTTFDVIIPLEIDTCGLWKAKESVQHASIEGARIILAEDNDLNTEIAKYMLESHGAVVTCAADGQEAEDAFVRTAVGEIDAILMDIMMPVKDGYTATKDIRALERPDAKTVPIIAMTANAFAEDKIAARDAGMNEHISKPLDAERAVATIARLIGEYRKSK